MTRIFHSVPNIRSALFGVAMLIVCLCSWNNAVAQTNSTKPHTAADAPANTANNKSSPDDTPSNVLAPEQWKRVDSAVERGLHWLAAAQQSDGAFPTMATGQPAVSSLCV